MPADARLVQPLTDLAMDDLGRLFPAGTTITTADGSVFAPTSIWAPFAARLASIAVLGSVSLSIVHPR